MEDEKDILERISAMEVQVKDISEVKKKLDSLYELMMGMKLENANKQVRFATKQECAACKKEIELRIDKVEEGRQKLFWVSLASGLTFLLWLLELLLNIKIKIGG